jgi:hypothetical protein
MARHKIRALGGVVLAGACIALAACTSSGSSSAGAAKANSTPVKSGTVTVRVGGKVICVMTVVNGKGTCNVPASTIGAGNKAVVGTYTGAGYKTAQSQPLYVSVTKASTKVTLSVSPVTLTYGSEQAAHVTVRVTDANGGGVPTGTVLVGSGATSVCTIKLSNGAGSCTMPAQALKAGSWSLAADYAGDAAHFSSNSAPVKITVKG